MLSRRATEARRWSGVPSEWSRTPDRTIAGERHAHTAAVISAGPAMNIAPTKIRSPEEGKTSTPRSRAMKSLAKDTAHQARPAPSGSTTTAPLMAPTTRCVVAACGADGGRVLIVTTSATPTTRPAPTPTTAPRSPPTAANTATTARSNQGCVQVR